MKPLVTINDPRLPKGRWAVTWNTAPGWWQARGDNYLQISLGFLMVQIPRPWLYSAACRQHPELLEPLVGTLPEDISFVLRDLMQGATTDNGWLTLPSYRIPEHLEGSRENLLVEVLRHWRMEGRLK